MQKFISFRNSRHFPSSAIKSLSSFFSSLPKPPPNTNSLFINYLMESLNFPQSRALGLSNKHSYVKSLEKPHNVCQFLKNSGFSDAHIQTTACALPQLLLCNVDKTLKPKIELFQNMGLTDSDLGKFISGYPLLLTASLEKKLIPSVQILKQVLVGGKNNENLTRTLRRCIRILVCDPKLRLLSNIEFLKSCGIVGSQLSMLLTREPRLFVMPAFKLKKLVSQLLDMGFLVHSRMLVYGLRALIGLSEETFNRKLELFRSFGFSEDKFITMFRKAPGMLTMSKEKLKLGLEYFLNEAELEKMVLFNSPMFFTYSLENRVIPRYRVFKIVMSRRLLNEKCSFPQLLALSEEKFFQKFVCRFGDDSDELFLAYKG